MTILGEDRDYLNAPEYEQLVERLSIEHREIADERIDDVVETIDSVPANGGCLLRSFRIVDPDGVFEYVRDTPNASVNNMLRQSDFLHDFLRSKELNETIDGLDTEEGFSGYHWRDGERDAKRREDGDLELEWYHPVYVDGFLAWVLIRGGAYESFDGTHAEAKELGRQFDRAVFEDRYEAFSAWRISNVQWAEWFVGVPHWDETLLLADEHQKILWLFMFTSTD